MNEGTLFSIIVFPKPWPPLKKIEMLSRGGESDGIKVLADTKGRYIFEIYSSEKESVRYTFQPIILEGSGRAILAIRWTQQDASLWLNETEILLDAAAHSEPVVLKTKEDHLPTTGLILGDIDPNKSNNDAEFLFLEVIKDIDQKVFEGGRYNLIKAAGLLRQLFLDDSPLAHVVNRPYKKKLLFEIVDHQEEPPLQPVAYRRDLDGFMFPNAKRIQVSLDDFLSTPCFTLDGITVTVRDLVRTCANVMGGVHFGFAKTEEESSVLNWDRAFKIIGEEPSLATIKGICRICLRALKPLVEAILDSASKSREPTS